MNSPDRLSARVGTPPPLGELTSRWLAPTEEDRFALPVVQNFVGSVQCCWGPAGIQNWLAPPTGLPTPTGRLYALDGLGRPAEVDPAGTSYQVSPWEIRRRHPVVSARTRLHSGDTAVTERLTFHRAGRYALVFTGLCRTWSFTDYWNLPPEDVPQLNVRFEHGAVCTGDNKTFGLARFFVPDGGRVRVHTRHEDFLAGRQDSHVGRLAVVSFDAAEGEEVAWTGVQGTDPGLVPRGDDADAEETWSRVWAAAFTPGNEHFSGSLPALRFGNGALDRLYYMGVLALLHGRRTPAPTGPRARFATGGQAIWTSDLAPLTTAYTTGATEGAATTSFLWELHLVAPLLARLDPDVLRRQLEAFLVAGTDRHWGIDILTGRGVGMWYGINDGAVVTAAAAYLDHTGDRSWLDTVVGDTTVRAHLLRHVARHEELADGEALADYGEAHHVLECVSSYEHRLASFNALAAWCYRYAADVLDPEHAGTHRARADTVERAVLDLFDDGVFRCVTPTGERVVRTCLDFMYVGHYLGERLDDEHKRAMLRFFVAELETPDWMRALSPKDADSLTSALPEFQTYRADHQSTGAYDGWPGLSAEVRFRFGDGAATVDWLRRISAVTWEGPFGQAHWTGIDGRDPAAPARKASFFNGNCYLLVSGSTLSTAMLHHATIEADDSARPLPRPLAEALDAHGLGDPAGPVLGVPVTGGVSSDVWRVELPSGPVCVKRALSKLKVARDWRVSTARAGREAAWLRLAATIDPAAAGHVLAFDEERGVLVLEWIDARVWKSRLLAGEVDDSTARLLGERLVRLHAGAVDHDRAEWSDARPLFEALRIAPYLRATAARHGEVADRLLAIADDLAASAVTLVHGDVSPKNVLVGADGPVLVDAECASPGDPAFDVAFCVNHLLLKAVIAGAATAGRLVAAAGRFAAAYLAGVAWEPPDDVDGRAARILPALGLARVDGLSPVEYLTDPADQEFVRATALAGVVEPAPGLDTACRRWLAALDARRPRG
ncbi:aminoglycoside phosphotransferase family protein [Actinophytocola oryzae]|uniref:Fructosamine-3-kinase n=1 Tax=Actinophytocola oryzae TaxID=502181 RepID=A0A4R7UTV1_9PSEU|nr:aminoglycoside phosphotransferase family protein [Actinophytocola oryzae]TDV38572.1 fructosamine-3-kinase [Actinophytocola oryzae]